jgi:hypothetical protein
MLCVGLCWSMPRWRSVAPAVRHDRRGSTFRGSQFIFRSDRPSCSATVVEIRCVVEAIVNDRRPCAASQQCQKLDSMAHARASLLRRRLGRPSDPSFMLELQASTRPWPLTPTALSERPRARAGQLRGDFPGQPGRQGAGGRAVKWPASSSRRLRAPAVRVAPGQPSPVDAPAIGANWTGPVPKGACKPRARAA